MKKNIDDLALEIMQEKVTEDLSKALPPRIAYRLRRWLQQQGRKVRLFGTKQTANVIARKMKEAAMVKELKKNQVLARTYDDSMVKFDFGADVPDTVKKAAMMWAKKKGLKAVEASLAKSKSSTSSITYANSEKLSDNSNLLAAVLWEIPE